MPHERRHFVRISFDNPALLTTSKGVFDVQVVDLSLKGALVVLPPQATLTEGLPCQLTVPLTETGDHIAMTLTVAHMQSPYAGLRCTSIDLDSVTHLRRLLELHLGDPALLERDLAELLQ
jgi:hypothetical protein